MVPAHRVVAVRDRVYQPLEPGELGVLGYDFEPAVVAQVLEFPQLVRYELLGALDLLGQEAVEGPVLHDIEPPARFHLVPVEAQYAHSRPRHEPRRVLGEEQHSRIGEMAALEEPADPEDLLAAGIHAKL